jgi:hypothetical protein
LFNFINLWEISLCCGGNVRFSVGGCLPSESDRLRLRGKAKIMQGESLKYLKGTVKFKIECFGNLNKKNFEKLQGRNIFNIYLSTKTKHLFCPSLNFLAEAQPRLENRRG